MTSKKVAIFRREFFCAAHRLHNALWDDETNFNVFGKCSNPNYHGHNYEIVVKVTGIPDPVSGVVEDLKKLSILIKEKVKNKLDHKNLNLDVEEFKNLNPTIENIAIVIYDLLREHIKTENDLSIRVYETQKNFAEYPAS